MNKEETTQRVEILEFIFENVNNWVHFAEAKSAMIIALNIAIISVTNDFISLENRKFGFYLILVLIIVSTIFALGSVIPNEKIIYYKMFKFEGEPNYLFYSYIASFANGEQYMEELYQKYWGQSKLNVTQLEKDLCGEIYENSKIAASKYKLFEVSSKIDVLVCFIVIIMLLIA
jgi:hypothetical protein